MKKALTQLLLVVMLGMSLLSLVPTPKLAYAEVMTPQDRNSAQAQNNNTPTVPADSSNTGCGITNLFRCISDAVLWAPGFIMSYLVMPLMSLMVYLTGMMLNWSVHYSVVEMAERVREAHVDEVWRVMRDLANMGFIFVLVYTALSTMFNANSDYRKVIVRLVIAALLVNFSMFLTKAVIDASNVLAMLFYKAIAPGQTDPTTGIGASLMKALGMQSFYDLAGVAKQAGINGTKMAIVGISSSLVMLIASFTFLAVAIMFVIRFVVLLLVIVLSPLMVVAYIFPNSEKYRSQWQNALINQSFFAPVYFMLTWVTIKITQGLLGTGGVGNMAGAVLGKANADGSWTADPAAAAGFIKFAIIIAFMIASILIAKGIAEKSGGIIGDLTKRALGAAGGATVGLAGRAGRGTVGRFGSNVAESRTLMDRAAKGGMSGKLARLQLAAGKKASNSSFDLRAAPGGSKLGAGKAHSGGFAKDLENKVKSEKEFAEKQLKTSDMAAYLEEQRLKDLKAGRLSDKDIEKLEKERLNEAVRLQEEKDRLEKERERAEKHGASKDELDEFDSRLHFLGRDMSAATSGDHKAYLESRVERIKGVEEKEAKKRAAAAINKTESEFSTLLKNKDSAAQEALKKESRLNETDVRKTIYARGLETPRTFGRKFDILSRHLGFGSTKKEYTAAAADIRKGMKKKSSKDKLAEAAKEMAKEDEDSGGGTTPTTGGSAPTPGGAPSTTPPTTP